MTFLRQCLREVRIRQKDPDAFLLEDSVQISVDRGGASIGTARAASSPFERIEDADLSCDAVGSGARSND
ncbi:hypothetical protein J7E62_32510 [Variovorax paradoxus]|nr:hypothetical protein [Variovorax paradoxus]